MSRNNRISVALPPQNWKFIKDDNLRETLERDYAELRELLKVRAPKSTLVLCGSILEAVLISVLKDHEAPANQKFRELFPGGGHKLEDWKLYQLISVAAKLELLPSDHARLHADLIRDYRNLIHPMADVRQASNLDTEIVEGVLALFKRIVRLLSQKYQLDWDEPSFLKELKKRKGNNDVETAKRILAWAESRGLSLDWGKSIGGSCTPRLDHKGEVYSPFVLRTDGKVQVSFGFLMMWDPFKKEAKRLELLERLNRIPGVRISANKIDRFPAIALSKLGQENGPQTFIETLEWVMNEIEGAQ